MESDAAPPLSGSTAADGTLDSDAIPTPERKQEMVPISNVILSEAVTTAISQLDTKRAFDMMLLNEQMTAMESESKCLKQESTFLRDALAKQTQETSEMYHYFHDKMDAHVATISALESEVATARAENERLKEHHALELSNAQMNFQVELSNAKAEIASLRDELYQVHLFATQKKEMEALVHELQEELAANAKQFAAEKNALELKAMFEKDRVKREMQTHMKDTKEALLLRTDEQLNTTTKRTLMENDHFMEELSFQSRETEKLLVRFRHVEEEVQRLRVANKVLEENELEMAKKNHYYQKILGQLKKQRSVTEKHTAGLEDEDANATTSTARQELKAAQDELSRVKTNIVALEESLKHAHQWIRAFQQEKQFVVAQQDEIIQFLCRALSDAASELSDSHVRRVSVGDLSTSLPNVSALVLADAAKTTTTMEELVTSIAPIALDELSSDETRQVLLLLLEKMKTYQEQVATIYRDRKVFPVVSKSPDDYRDLLSKQLGVELPPIVPPSGQITSPLKFKRRIQPYAPASCTTIASTIRPPPAQQDSLNQQIKPRQTYADTTPLSPNRLLSVATSQFNFLQTTPPPVRKPIAQKHPLSPTKHVAPRIVPRRDRDSSDTTDAKDGGDKSSLAMMGTLSSAWSTDSLPENNGTSAPDPPSNGEVQKNASVSRRKA